MKKPDPRETLRLARKAQRQASRREEILRAARAVLAEHGVAGFNLGAVAAAADVSKPSLHYYFTGREDLIAALVEGILRGEVDAVVAAVEAAETGIDALVASLRAKVAHYADDLDAFRVAYLWPAVIGVPPGFTVERIYPLAKRANDAIERRLREDARLAKEHDPRKLANLSFVTAQGILALHAGLPQVGGTARHSLTQLTDEACALFARVAERDVPRRSKGRARNG